MSRRNLLAALPAVAAAPIRVTPRLSRGAHPDRQLLSLVDVWQEQISAMDALRKRIDAIDGDGAEWMRLEEEWGRLSFIADGLTHRIAAEPAQTITGLQAKVRVVRRFEEYEGEETQSLLADIERGVMA
jgi:hypothetical protein